MSNKINGYDLSRDWFNFCFENPEKIKPVHTAMYFFIIEHCNRLGWKEKFGLPMEMTKDAIGISNYRTYSNTLKDLIDFGFIVLIQKSKNQYSSTIIALAKNTIATTKALDKALQKHSTKQGQSIVCIDKPINKEPLNNIVYPLFDDFWNLYDKKIDRPKSLLKWNKLNQEQKEKIINYLPNYIKSTPEKGFRKNPTTFLNNESWNDEIIKDNSQSSNQSDAVAFITNLRNQQKQLQNG